MPILVYYLALAAFFTHELDAVMAQEWRLLYGLRSLSEAAAYPLFILIHLPLFFVFLWLSHHRRPSVRTGFRALASGFLIVHAGLHLRLADAPLNGFDGLLSYGLIHAAGLLGALYLLLWLCGQRRGREPGLP